MASRSGVRARWEQQQPTMMLWWSADPASDNCSVYITASRPDDIEDLWLVRFRTNDSEREQYEDCGHPDGTMQTSVSAQPARNDFVVDFATLCGRVTCNLPRQLIIPFVLCRLSTTRRMR